MGEQAGAVTRIGFAIIGVGIALLILRVADWVDAESADILSVLAIVIGAVVVAIDGERPSKVR
ncbi:MAG: hypothetical protein KDB02_14375 [Acidimicrobiales bacterium]|nr:hypothetical protein [Acidimicrobiales bacterium]